MKFYSNIDKSLRIVCGIASEENDEFITVREVTIATIINMWY
jgi:fructose-1,6-bisphosphatase